jgi:hypothetical protein
MGLQWDIKYKIKSPKEGVIWVIETVKIRVYTRAHG